MAQTPDILKRILRRKAEEVSECASQVSLRALSKKVESAPTVRPFLEVLQSKVGAGETGIVAELKKASPSKGLLRQDFDPQALARSYEKGGAACLSVLTDRDFFQGDAKHLQQARGACNLPVLRKDFIIDAYQVYEARALGADCILLIVAALGDAMLKELLGLVEHLEMDALVEVHNDEEMERALGLDAPLIGINNRDLHTFQTNLQTTLDLLHRVPEQVLLVTESGIHSHRDVEIMRAAGVNAFLVGEALMRASDPGQKLAELFDPRVRSARGG